MACVTGLGSQGALAGQGHMGLSAEKEPAKRRLLFRVSLTSLLFGRAGLIHSHLPFRQPSHPEVKSLPEIQQAEWGE